MCTYKFWAANHTRSTENNAPLFPTTAGAVASKSSVVLTFEQIGTACGQPLLSDHGLRLFGGHIPRVTGARYYAALGLEINKIRLLARHSGETILRYVLETPLASIRSDLGIASRGRQVLSATGTVMRQPRRTWSWTTSRFA